MMENKKERLTIKEIAAYLPYGLKAEMLDYKCDYVGKQYDEIIGVHQWDKNCLYWSALTVGGSKPNIERIKPLLRPLSDLTKEIEHNGERFVPKDRLRKISGAFEPDDDFKNTFAIHTDDGFVICFSALCIHLNQLELFEKLHEWHFDTKNLLARGLALPMEAINLKNKNYGN